jgi:hypothetical protein
LSSSLFNVQNTKYKKTFLCAIFFKEQYKYAGLAKSRFRPIGSVETKRTSTSGKDPVIGKDKSVDMLKDSNITIGVEAWMSENIDLLYRSVGKKKDKKAENYDPIERC